MALRPDGVALVRLAKGWRPVVTHKQTVLCDGAQGTEKWSGAIGCLTEALSQEPWRGADVTVVLSSHFVRYALIPGSMEFKGKREEQAYGKYLLSKLEDGGSERWELRIGTAKPGRGRVVAAVEKGLLGALGEVVKKTGCRLASVRPYLMTAFNPRRKLVGKEPSWFVALEEDCCVLGRWGEGQWLDVKNRRLSGEVEEELPRLLAQERLMAADEALPDKVVVFSPGRPGMKPRFPLPWQVTVLSPAPLPGFTPHADGAVAWAME